MKKPNHTRHLKSVHSAGAAHQQKGAGTAAPPIRPDRLLRLSAVVEMTGLGKSSIYADPELSSVKRRISSRLVGWLESDVARWLESRPKSSGN